MHPVEEYQNIILTVDRLNECDCDAHKKKVSVELIYNAVHRKFNQFGDQTSWGSDELEIRCGRENQHTERLGPRPPV